MHRTEGDGFITDPIGGQNVFADEDPPARDATQLRYQEANAYQEEIANVILAAGASLNAPSESIQQMVQLRDAINTLIASAVSAEAALRTSGDANVTSYVNSQISAVNAVIAALNASNIADDSAWGLTTVYAVLNQIKLQLIANGATANYQFFSPATLTLVPASGSSWVDAGSKVYMKRPYGSKFLQMWGSISGTIGTAPMENISFDLTNLHADFAGWGGAIGSTWANMAQGYSTGPLIIAVQNTPTSPVSISFQDYRNSGGSNKIPMGGFSCQFNWVGSFI